MAAFKSKDQAKIDELSKKSKYMNKMSMEMMQMNMRPMMITIIPLLLIFYFLMPTLFSYTVAISPIPLNVIPGDFFQLTCTAEKMALDAAAKMVLDHTAILKMRSFCGHGIFLLLLRLVARS